MISFQKLAGPHGIPVYFQPLPNLIKSVSIRLLVFVGAADDEFGGQPGVYHWFEHVPFRGTERFPGGYRDTANHFDHVSGKVRAHTGYQRTAYYAHVPKDQWSKALEVVVDLVFHPLLTDEGINAERTVIFEELSTFLSSAPGYAWYHAYQMLWPGHPFGHPILGSEDNLQAMDAIMLRAARETGYSRNRCVLLVAGDISENEVLHTLDLLADRLPDNNLSERRAPASYGTLPTWQNGQQHVMDTPFGSSVIFLTFSVPPTRNNARTSLWYDLLSEIYGGPQSPVIRILREERNLVYGASVFVDAYFDGGVWGFFAVTRPQNEQAVINALWDVIASPEIRTAERLGIVRQAQAGQQAMRAPKPSAITKIGENRLAGLGQLVNDQEYEDIFNAFSHDEVVTALDQVTPDKACTFIFHGCK